MTGNSSGRVGAGVGGISVSCGGLGHWLCLPCGGDGCRQVTSWRAGGFRSGGVRNVTDTGGINESYSFWTMGITHPLIQHRILEDLNPPPYIHFLPSDLPFLSLISSFLYLQPTDANVHNRRAYNPLSVRSAAPQKQYFSSLLGTEDKAYPSRPTSSLWQQHRG